MAPQEPLMTAGTGQARKSNDEERAPADVEAEWDSSDGTTAPSTTYPPKFDEESADAVTTPVLGSLCLMATSAWLLTYFSTPACLNDPTVGIWSYLFTCNWPFHLSTIALVTTALRCRSKTNRAISLLTPEEKCPIALSSLLKPEGKCAAYAFDKFAYSVAGLVFLLWPLCPLFSGWVVRLWVSSNSPSATGEYVRGEQLIGSLLAVLLAVVCVLVLMLLCRWWLGLGPPYDFEQDTSDESKAEEGRMTRGIDAGPQYDNGASMGEA